MTGAPALNAVAILDVLEATLHASASEWLFLRELRVGTGHRHNAAQRLDAFALNCLPHRAMLRVCYEVKTSRADFLGELKRPIKRRIGMRYSNEFYFVTPRGLLALAELPVECGLMEVSLEPVSDLVSEEPCSNLSHFDPRHRAFCTVTAPAPWRDTPGPTWQFAAAMLRNQRRSLEAKSAPPPKQLSIAFATASGAASQTSASPE